MRRRTYVHSAIGTDMASIGYHVLNGTRRSLISSNEAYPRVIPIAIDEITSGIIIGT